ncbi:glycosyltransferase family 87 protein [Sorangium cellulosum]|uniref:glycosyltransferase family 87 protein n=1 Tax=Sorangium cellulosum TaxID=56 RepID=UPI0013313253|nr:glycosyltransferase family 87 protein [Sorangium cellulosum]
MTAILATLKARLSSDPWYYAAAFVFCAGAAWLCVLDIVLKQPVAIDFKSFYTAAVAASRGLDVYDVKVLEGIASEKHLPHKVTFPYLYPPFFAYVFSWFSRLRPGTAQGLWSGLAVVSYGVAAVCAMVAIRSASRDRDGAAGAPAVGAARAPAVTTALIAFVVLLTWTLNLRNSLAMGQVNPLVLMFLCAALALFFSGKDLPAGLALSVAAGIKVTPILLAVPWLLQRRFRALAGLAAGFAALFLVSLPLGAAPAWIEFLKRLPRMSHGATIPGLFSPGTVPNFSLAGFYTRLFASDTAAVKVASVVTILLLLGATLALGLGGGAPSPSRWLRMLLPLLVTMIVASPFTYVHHVLYLFPAALFALDRATKQERLLEMGALLALISLATIDFPYVYERFKAPLPPLVLSMNLYVLLVLYGLGLYMLWRERRAEAAASGAIAAPARERESAVVPASGAAEPSQQVSA